jgi:formate-dependent nitrite reductase membrane component NrfD
MGASRARLKQADNVALILEIVLLVAFVALLGTAASFLLSVLNGILLIGGVLVIGLLVPLALQFRAGFQGVKAPTNLTVLIAVLILIGGFLMRMVIVMGGQGLL